MPSNRWLILLSAVIGVGIFVMMLAVIVGLFASTAPQPTATAPITTPTSISVAAGITYTPPPTAITPLPTLPNAYAATAAPSLTAAPPTAEASPTPPEESAPSDCTPPDGWTIHYVEPGETLFAYVVGSGGSVTTDDLRRANCLTSDLLQIGQQLYLPPGAAENAPSSDPLPAPADVSSGPRTADCAPHCTISIRPGWRAEQIAAAIDNVPVGFWGVDFLAAVSAGAAAPGYDFLAGRPPGQSLEGFLYPGTYELSNSDTAESFRDMLLAAFAANLPGDAAASAAARGLSLYEAVTLASVIQRESWAYSEQVLISSVFHNRLRSGGRLGSTVTTQYALGYPGNWWPSVSGGQINTDSPYNTNIYAGLPPSPICNPSAEAISAAINPADTDYLFFTGNCRGSGNVYAATYEEHLANVNACR